MKVAAGTVNPVKIQAIKNVFSKIFRDVEVIPVPVDSKVGSEPFNSEVIKGAIERAKQAYESRVDLAIGIEAGLFRNPYTISGYLDIQYCAIYDGERITIGCGAGFEYPKKVIERVLREKKEIGTVMEELTGIKDIGETIGSIGYLSKGILNRITLTEQAILMALIPRLNNKIYFEDIE
ncbi:MAG: inosine/xanthosine triphosphatase [Methanocellales archaeon]